MAGKFLKIAVNPATGARIGFDGEKWVPIPADVSTPELEGPSPIKQVLRPIAPTIGAAGGTLLGGPLVGGIPGGLAGEALNQAVGLSQPGDIEGMGLGVLIQAFTGGLGKVGGQVSRISPAIRSVKKAPLLSEAESLSAKLRPAVSASQRFGELKKMGGLTITDFPNTARTLSSIEPEIQKGFKGGLGTVRSKVKDLQAMLIRAKNEPTPVSPQGVNEFGSFIPGVKRPILPDVEEIRIKVHQLGELISTLKKRGGMGFGDAKRLWQGLLDDLDQAPTVGAAGQKLALARTAAKKEFSLNELDDVIFAERHRVPGLKHGVFDIESNKVLDKLEGLTNPKHPKYNKNFAEGLKDELPGIKKFFTEMESFGPIQVPKLGPGSLLIRGQLGSMGAGIGGALTGGSGAGVGALAGIITPDIAESILVRMVASNRGRRIVEQTLKGNRNRLTPAAFQAFAAFLASEVNQ